MNVNAQIKTPAPVEYRSHIDDIPTGTIILCQCVTLGEFAAMTAGDCSVVVLTGPSAGLVEHTLDFDADYTWAVAPVGTTVTLTVEE